MVELFDAKGEHVDGVGQSYDIKPGPLPREWIMKVTLSGYKPPLACRLKVEITDGEAAPLQVKQELALP